MPRMQKWLKCKKSFLYDDRNVGDTVKLEFQEAASVTP